MSPDSVQAMLYFYFSSLLLWFSFRSAPAKDGIITSVIKTIYLLSSCSEAIQPVSCTLRLDASAHCCHLYEDPDPTHLSFNDDEQL